MNASTVQAIHSNLTRFWRRPAPRRLRENGRSTGQYQRFHAHRRDHALPCAILQWSRPQEMKLKTRRINQLNGEEMQLLMESCHRRCDRQQQHPEESTVRHRPALATTSGRPWISNVNSDCCTALTKQS